MKQASNTRPETASLLVYQPDVLRSLLHLAGQVQSSRYYQKRICPSDLDFGIEALDVDLGGGHGLLSDSESFTKAVDLCRTGIYC